jgi:hypothetical protein
MQLTLATPKCAMNQGHVFENGIQKVIVLVVFMMREGCFNEMACVVPFYRISSCRSVIWRILTIRACLEDLTTSFWAQLLYSAR